MKTRTEAARELWSIYNAYEARKCKYTTIYRRIFKQGNAWRLIGYAHDYIC